jgi:hypothetical protein
VQNAWQMASHNSQNTQLAQRGAMPISGANLTMILIAVATNEELVSMALGINGRDTQGLQNTWHLQLLLRDGASFNRALHQAQRLTKMPYRMITPAGQGHMSMNMFLYGSSTSLDSGPAAARQGGGRVRP